MILYHYSVDSYKGGSTLLNDYKQQARLAEPFLLALQTTTGASAPITHHLNVPQQAAQDI